MITVLIAATACVLLFACLFSKLHARELQKRIKLETEFARFQQDAFELVDERDRFEEELVRFRETSSHLFCENERLQRELDHWREQIGWAETEQDELEHEINILRMKLGLLQRELSIVTKVAGWRSYPLPVSNN